MMTTFAGSTPGTPPSSIPFAAVDPFEGVGGGLDREPAGHLGHRRQERQPAGRRGDRLVGDAHRAALDEVRGLPRVRREVEIGEKDLTCVEHRALLGLGLLDLDDHLRPREHRFRIRGDGCPDAGVVRVVRTDAGPRPALYDGLVAVQDHLVHAVRGESHAVLVVLGLLGYADQHVSNSGQCRRRA